MRCLGIPNTAHFANVTNITDARACKCILVFHYYCCYYCYLYYYYYIIIIIIIIYLVWEKLKSLKAIEQWKSTTEVNEY